MDPSRRGLLRDTLYTAALAIPPWPDAQARANAVRGNDNPHYGREDVSSVIAMTEAFSGLDDQHGGSAVRPPAAAYLVNTVMPYLHAQAPTLVRASMLTATADLCYLLGWMAADDTPTASPSATTTTASPSPPKPTTRARMPPSCAA